MTTAVNHDASLRDQFQAALREGDRIREGYEAGLRAALAGQPGWGEWEATWSHTEYTAGRDIETRRRLNCARTRTDHWLKVAWVIKAEKFNGHGQPCDVAEFTDAAEAVAWIAAPRSSESLIHRRTLANDQRHAERDNVDLAGLPGKRVDSGRNGKGQVFTVIQFEAVGRVRITTLGPGEWRIALNRRTRVVMPGEGQDAKKAVRAAIEELQR